MTIQIPWLDIDIQDFPDVDDALEEPNGLLAAGGALTTERLLDAYAKGIFPWHDDDMPVLWWSPHPRAVLYPKNLVISRSLHKVLKNKPWHMKVDTCFDEVITKCSKVSRKGQDGTWIHQEMINAYLELHDYGYAHSFEVFDENNTLIGGLYGVSLGRLFFGESMFHIERDASKYAFVHMVIQAEHWGFPLIDCQLPTEHLQSLGATEITRDEFMAVLKDNGSTDNKVGPWALDFTYEDYLKKSEN